MKGKAARVMPRRSRQISESGIHHIMLRGINRSAIFHDEEDCEVFLQYLSESLTPPSAGLRDGFFVTPEPCGGGTKEPSLCNARPAQIYAYCLMGNHVHLLMKAGDEPLSSLFKRFGVRYVYWYNHKYDRVGHLFQDRFKSAPVEDDAYLLAVYRYIAQNPVKAGLCEKPGGYRWASFGNPRPDLRCAPLPTDYTEEQLREYVLSDQPDIHPFPERVTDREAEALLKKVTGVKYAGELQEMPREEIVKTCEQLVAEGVSLRQISRLTGIYMSNLSRWCQ